MLSPFLQSTRFALLQEEKRKNIGHGINVMVEPIALYATNGSNPNFRPTQNQGYNGGKKGNSKKERPVCSYCGLTRH